MFQLQAPAASCSIISYDAGWHGVVVPPHHVDASFSDKAFFTRCLLLEPNASDFSNFMHSLSSFVCFQPYLPPDDHFFSSFFSGRLRHMPHSLVYQPVKGHSLCASEHAFLLHARMESLFWLEIAAEAASMLSSKAKAALFPDAMFSKLQHMRDAPLEVRKSLQTLPSTQSGSTVPKPASVCIATCDESPRLVASGAGLVRALQACGLPVQERPWSSVGSWDAFSHVCVMQTWDYPSHVSAFSSWLQDVSLAGSIIMNDLRYIKWNLDKKYMLDLQADGVCMPRTVAMDCSDVARSTSPFGQRPGEPGDMTGQIAVVKPQVGCSALGVCQIIIGEESPVSGPVLLQEFIPSVSMGELSLIFFDGRFSHCVRKMPKAGEWRTNWKFGGRSHAERHPPSAALVPFPSISMFRLPTLSSCLCRSLPRKLSQLLPGTPSPPLRLLPPRPFGLALIASCAATKLCSWSSSSSSQFCSSTNHPVTSLTSRACFSTCAYIKAPFQVQPTIWRAPSIGACATILSHHCMSRAVSAGMFPPSKVARAMLTCTVLNVQEMNERLEIKEGCCLLHPALYFGPSISSGRTHASNCCSVQ